MVPSVRTPYLAEPLGVVMRRALENQPAGSATEPAASFGETLTAAEGGQDPVTSPPTNRHEPPPAATQDENELERLPPIPSDKTGRTYRDFENPIPKVAEKLRELGVDPNNVQFELWDEVVANLGGHYTNHYIRVTMGNGHQENYSIEWTLRNPMVTAADIQRLLRTPPPFSVS